MTRPWKRSVLEALVVNRKRGREPKNMAELETSIGLGKSGMGRTFKGWSIDGDKVIFDETALLDENGKLDEQTNSTAVDAICEVLGIDPPFDPQDEPRAIVEGVVADDLKRIALTLIAGVSRVARDLPDDQRRRLDELVRAFMADFPVG